MTAVQELAKDHEERNLERKGAYELWRRTWKSAMAIALRSSHEMLSGILQSYLARMEANSAKPDAPVSQADVRLARMTWLIFKMLDGTRERMLDLALHPTRPKGRQSSRGGGRPRDDDPGAERDIASPTFGEADRL